MWPRRWVEVQLYSSITATLEGGEWSAARPGRTLPPRKTRYPLYRRLGGLQGRSGRAEDLVPTGFRSRTVQPRSQSLYRLNYTDHTFKIYITVIQELGAFVIKTWRSQTTSAVTFLWKWHTYIYTYIHIYIHTHLSSPSDFLSLLVKRNDDTSVLILSYLYELYYRNVEMADRNEPRF